MDNSAMEDRILALKLRRIEQLNANLRETLARDRIPASRAAALIIQTLQDTPDPLIPLLWKTSAELNRYRIYQEAHQSRGGSTGCCAIV